MKLLLLLTSLASLSIFGKSCNQGNTDSNVQHAPDTLSAALDTFSTSIDTNTTMMDSLSPKNIGGDADTVSKDTKYGTSTGAHEAPKHDAPNQEKIDSIKAAKKKKKND